MDKVKTAFVGCGGIAGAHVKGLRTLWEKGIRIFEVIATCDVDEGRAARMADDIAVFQTTKPRVYTDIEEMLAKEDELEAVDICSVHRIHHNLAIACLDAKKHVTIEKPLALTIRAGHAILDAARRNGRILQVAENYRRAPSERAINWAIRTGRIGKLRMIYWVDVGERLWYWGWRDHKDQAGGGWTLDGGVHFADLFRYHIGEVEELYAVSKTYNNIRYRKHQTLEDPVEATVEDTTMATLRFENGVLGEWVSTMSAPGKGINFRAVYGDKGSIRWGEGLVTRDESLSMEELQTEFLKSLSEEEKERLFPQGVTDTIATELAEFYDAIRGKGKIEITGEEGLKDQAICMAVYESSAINAPVKVKDVEECKIEVYQAELNESVGL